MGLSPAGVTMYHFFKNTRPAAQVLTLLLSLVLFFILASGITVLVSTSCGGADTLGVDASRWLQVMDQILIFVCPALMWAVLFHGRAGEALALHFSGRFWLLAAAGVLCYMLMYPLFDLLTGWNESWRLPQSLQPLEEAWRKSAVAGEQQVELFVSQPGVGNLLFNLLVMALVPAVCEELFFRGALQQAIRQWLGNAHFAILLTAVVFSLAHGDMFGFVPRLAMGVALGYLFCYGGSLLVNIAAHFVNNAIVVTAYYLYYSNRIITDPSDPLGFPWWVAVTGVGLSVVLFVMLVNLNCKKTIQKKVV